MKQKTYGPANDQIPSDELLLAKAIQNAKAQGLRWCAGSNFADRNGFYATKADAYACCAVGALLLASDTAKLVPMRMTGNIVNGNDLPWKWIEYEGDDRGESMGWAYRQAMRYMSKNKKLDKAALGSANDSIPDDELLLAQALQNVHEWDLKFCTGATYRNKDQLAMLTKDNAVYCCALGAAFLEDDSKNLKYLWPTRIIKGNDDELYWSERDGDLGESFGWGLRQAMAER